MQKVAIMVDGGFFVKRLYSELGYLEADTAAKFLMKYSLSHWKSKGKNEESKTLYRIFYYDCLPSGKKVFNPITRKTVDLSKTELYSWMHNFINTLRSQRKVALRLGKLSDAHAGYYLSVDTTKKLIQGRIEELEEKHLQLKVEQKGVDMKLGIDVASLVLKQQVDQIILISGDSDFVPAAKLARREGVDFVLDPLWAHVSPDLFEHIDGMKSHHFNQIKLN